MRLPHAAQGPPLHAYIDRVVFEYCKYWSEGFPHKCRKRTAIFRVGADYEQSNHDCGFCLGRRHLETIGNSTAPLRDVHRKDEMYPIPPLL
jgi:hypothetical protein